MNIILKDWIYKKIQSEAFCKNKTIVWEKTMSFENGDIIDTYSIKVDSIVRETEKAVCVNCVYWWLGYREVNFTEYKGYKVWIPKSAICAPL